MAEESIIRDQIVISDEEQENDGNFLLNLTHTKCHPLRTRFIRYTIALPEYPISDPDGFTYIVAVPGQEQSAVANAISSVQYAMRLNYRERPMNSETIFGSVPLLHTSAYCTGVKLCQYADPALKDMKHTSISKTQWDEIEAIREGIPLAETEQVKRRTYMKYLIAVKLFRDRRSCGVSWKDTCKPTLEWGSYLEPSGVLAAYIRCVNTGDALHTHFTQKVIDNHRFDMVLLEWLFRDIASIEHEFCGNIEANKGRAQFCLTNHLQGRGKLQIIGCKVQYHWLVPVNLTTTPFYAFLSIGIHSHPPPPPAKPPQAILLDLIKVIRSMEIRNLTPVAFLMSPELKAFCAQFNALSLNEIHGSLGNMGRIAAIIQKERLLAYPQGQGKNGLLFQWQINQGNIREYIVEITDTLIICQTREQAEIMQRSESFEVDMSYKRVKDSKTQEVVFAKFVEKQNRIITLARVFTSGKSDEEAYALIFSRVSASTQRYTGRPLRFFPIHGSGIQAVVMDMDLGQWNGLARYLDSISDLNIPKEELAMSLVIFCQIHFKRGIRECLRGVKYRHGAKERMMSILDTPTKEDYQVALRIIIESEPSVKIQEWAKHKMRDNIASGLHRGSTKVPWLVFDQTRHNTNAVEQSHFKVNNRGRQLTLIQAIDNGRAVDRKDMEEFQSFEKKRLRPHYRANTTSEAMYSHMARCADRQQEEFHDPNKAPSENSISMSFSTTGVPVQTRLVKRLKVSRKKQDETTRPDISGIEDLQKEEEAEDIRARVLEKRLANRKRELELEKLN
ncbi:hypothetical protein N7508_001304 [Penicillium antarcticum]|uniref:uncharacterized protein n=1 Tax=Penicillium antarcticum TaxID=416450 RepID=UPI002388F1B6|nr:uncharacterized protein N7508_001304 [Penicillium antarcticum]KAJ5316796.1 hypothetical protein N7508_001304 [Penicillium antarcticum]